MITLSGLFSVMVGFRLMVFNDTLNHFSVVSWGSVLMVEETGVPGENHRSFANKFYYITLYRVYLAQAVFELTTLVGFFYEVHVCTNHTSSSCTWTISLIENIFKLFKCPLVMITCEC